MTVRQALLCALLLASCVDEVDLRLPPTSPSPIDAGDKDPDSGMEGPSECETQGLFCNDSGCPIGTQVVGGLACGIGPSGQPLECCAPDPSCEDMMGVFICTTSTVCPPSFQPTMFRCFADPAALCCGR